MNTRTKYISPAGDPHNRKKIKPHAPVTPVWTHMGSTLLSDTLSDTLSFNMSRRNCHLGQGSEAKTTHESVRLCDRCRCCERQRASVEWLLVTTNSDMNAKRTTSDMNVKRTTDMNTKRTTRKSGHERKKNYAKRTATQTIHWLKLVD
jgi:hypothetical protein